MDFKIYDKEAIHAQVSSLAVSNSLLAIGYTSGTILVYSMEEP